jgi:hypothetical protein
MYAIVSTQNQQQQQQQDETKTNNNNNFSSKIKELKESYTLLIPEEVKRLFPTICHINIFLFIRKMEMHKKHLIHQFRDVKNEIRYILYRWKKKDLRDEQIDDLDTVKEKHRLSYLYTVKSNLKTEIVNYRNAYSKMEEVITNEIKMAELKKNRIWCWFGNRRASHIPSGHELD